MNHKRSSVVGAVRRFNYLGWAVVVGVVLLWEAIVKVGLLKLDYLPPPSEVWDAVVELARQGVLWEDITHTMGVTLIASVLAIALGILAGTLIGVSRVVSNYSMATVDFLRSLPVIALMPVALLIWGPVEQTEVIVATYAALWPILINTTGAVTGIPGQLHEVSSTLGLGRREKMMKVVIPAAVPGILVGARLAVVSAFVVAIVAEMLINPAGIGGGMVSAQQALAPERLFAYAILAGTLGYLVNLVLTFGVRAMFPGHRAITLEGAAA